MSNKPFRVCVVMENGDDNRADFFDIGKVWRNRDGVGMSGKSIFGKIVILPPREDRDERPARGGGEPFDDAIPFAPEVRG